MLLWMRDRVEDGQQDQASSSGESKDERRHRHARARATQVPAQPACMPEPALCEQRRIQEQRRDDAARDEQRLQPLRPDVRDVAVLSPSGHWGSIVLFLASAGGVRLSRDGLVIGHAGISWAAPDYPPKEHSEQCGYIELVEAQRSTWWPLDKAVFHLPSQLHADIIGMMQKKESLMLLMPLRWRARRLCCTLSRSRWGRQGEPKLKHKFRLRWG